MLNVASRVEEMLKLDNISNPQGVCRVLEQEIKTLLENYLVINKEIIVRHRKESFCTKRKEEIGRRKESS